METYLGKTLEEIESMNRTGSDIASTQLALLNSRVFAPEQDLERFFEKLPGKRVLDVGCGWGYYSRRFVENGCIYTGIDISPGMVEAARQANPGLSYEIMSFRKLAFPDASFDAVWACCSLHYGPKGAMQSVLEGLHRVLMPGGLLYIIERLNDRADEEIVTSAISETPMYFSDWTYLELSGALEKSPFRVIEAKEVYHHGSMTFITKKPS